MIVRCQCEQIWLKFTTLAKFKSLWQFLVFILYFGKILNIFLEFLMLLGTFSLMQNGQISKNNVAIWSHCSLLTDCNEAAQHGGMLQRII